MNKIGLSFAMLSSVEIAHESIDQKFLPTDATISGSSSQKSNLFCELVVRYYWVQLDLRDSAQFTIEHVVAVHVFKDQQLCEDPGENAACLIDNRS